MNNVKVLLKAIILKKNKFLTVRRSPIDNIRPGYWDFPGGNLEFKEKTEKALAREVKEETSLKIKNAKVIKVETFKMRKNKKFYIAIGFISKFPGGEIKLSHEHSEYKWVTKKEFLKLKAAKYLKDFVRELK